MTLTERLLGVALTTTVTVVDDVKSKKFVKLSLMVYDALERFLAKMLIGTVTWDTEL